ncbi:adenosylcobinamide-phosphate synthase CbiB [Sneathiella glossodoripedis]|uniref:adenosylcobinamide-phosphate synthase CbiB n=1 Tax=Sneathiella glossodoripedis TaxID=418853 RepID=UPI0004729C5B|nr:adenosylcobinamide-phosphate synthase CbiB [Sneathiella glossodoripedis]
MSTHFYHFVDNSFDPFAIAFVALVIDLLIGDPKWLYRKIPHPVVLIGNFISTLEKHLLLMRSSWIVQVVLGTALVIVVVLITGFLGGIIASLLGSLPFGGILIAVVASTLIACRGLYVAVRQVRDGLSISLQKARMAVRHIVGRDPDSLNEAAVCRASIESLAENFLDGTVAPLFWFVVLGLPGLFAYKAINTLDSMIGHRNDRYEYFGKFAARLDDVANYIPARLTTVIIIFGAVFARKGDVRGAINATLADAGKHKSVNAGWAEAAMAGALGIALAGPRQYEGKVTTDHWMNEGGRKDCTLHDISAALALYRICVMGLLAGLIVIASLVTL